ncbi:TniQ family protein [Alteromonas australica]|uniref:TniQ family protein n=1 Tax=Alteromonas australica TaxID=589873 RepID=UPI0035C7A3F5
MKLLEPLPGEHLWSVISRSATWSGFSYDSLLKEKYDLSSVLVYPAKGDCRTIAKLAKHAEFASLRKENSPYPLWLLNFDDEEQTATEILSDLTTRTSETLIVTSNDWRYCVKCAEEDRQQHGTAYWHTEHNLPLVTHCTKHGKALVKLMDVKSLKALKMPNRISAKVIVGTEDEELMQWSAFVVEVYNQLRRIPNFNVHLRQKVFEALGIRKDVHGQLLSCAHFNSLLDEFEASLPKQVLGHCFQFYADKTRK